MTRRALMALLLFAAPAVAQESPTPVSGAVQGVILGEDGKPIADASVWCSPGVKPPMQPSTTSDQYGRFLLEGVPPAPEVFVSAYKESDGYPYNFFRFFKTSDRESPKVALSRNL